MAKALIVEIFGNASQFTKELDKAAGRTRTFSKAAGVAGLALAGGLAYGLEKSVTAATHFQSSMELVHTQAGVAQKSVDAMGKSVLELAGKVGTAPDELSTGLYHLASQGLRGKQAMDALRIAAEGAKVGQANLEDVTNALGGVLVSGIKGTKNYSQAMGVLNATVGAGDMRMQDLADAMGTGLPAAAAVAHVSLTQVAGALATFGDNNIRGAKAGTLLISTMRVLGHQSSAGAAALKDLGVNSDLLQAKLANHGLISALTYLKASIDGSGKSAAVTSGDLSEAFGGKQATGIKILLDELERLRTKVGEVDAGGNRFGSDWQAYSKTAQAASDRFKASLQAVEISIGDALIPAVATVTAKVAVFTEWLAKHTTVAKLAVVALAALAATLITVSVATRVVSAITIVARAATAAWTAAQWLLNAALDANPIGAVVIAIAALAAALVIAYKRSATFRAEVHQLWADVKPALEDIGRVAQTVLPVAFKAAGVAFKLYFGWIATEIKVIVAALNALISVAEKVASIVKSVVGTAGNVLSGNHGPGPKGGPRGGGPGTRPHLASGGIVTRPTVALIGEAGPEAVIPLSRGGGMGGNITVNVGPVHGSLDNHFADQLANKLATHLRGGRAPQLQMAIKAI